MDYGMSDLGPMNFGPMMEDSDYGRSMYEPTKISDKLQEQVDLAVVKFIKDGEKEATTMLKKYRKQLDAVSAALLEKESLDTAEFEKIVGITKAKRTNINPMAK
jgi:cell division protease FtsH